MVALTVEVGICQHQDDGHSLVGGVDQWAQRGLAHMQRNGGKCHLPDFRPRAHLPKKGCAR
jgi:hypothetical protein